MPLRFPGDPPTGGDLTLASSLSFTTFQTALTVSAWVRTALAPASGNRQGIFCVGDTVESVAFDFYLTTNNKPAVWMSKDDDAQYGFNEALTQLAADTWYHILWQRVAWENYQWYVNGVDDEDYQDFSATTDDDLLGSVNRMSIGSLTAAGINSTFGFNGDIADICVFDTVLSTANISQLASGADPRSLAGAGLRYFWPLFSKTASNYGSVGNQNVAWVDSGGASISSSMPPVWRPTTLRVGKPFGETGLVVNKGTHAHAADNVALTQAHALEVAESSHAHEADNVTVAQQGTLGIPDSEHAHSVDTLELLQVHTLALADAIHVHLADNVALTTAGLQYYYVDNISGNDGTGAPQGTLTSTPDNPYLTIVAALADMAVSAKQHLRLKGGQTFQEGTSGNASVNLGNKGGIDTSNRLVIDTYGTGVATIDGQGSRTYGITGIGSHVQITPSIHIRNHVEMGGGGEGFAVQYENGAENWYSEPTVPDDDTSDGGHRVNGGTHFLGGEAHTTGVNSRDTCAINPNAVRVTFLASTRYHDHHNGASDSDALQANTNSTANGIHFEDGCEFRSDNTTKQVMTLKTSGSITGHVKIGTDVADGAAMVGIMIRQAVNVDLEVEQLTLLDKPVTFQQNGSNVGVSGTVHLTGLLRQRTGITVPTDVPVTVIGDHPTTETFNCNNITIAEGTGGFYLDGANAVDITNCGIRRTDTSPPTTMRLLRVGSGITYTGDFNGFDGWFGDATNGVRVGGVDYATLAAYQAGEPTLDINSNDGAASFRNAGSGDYGLALNSAWANAGTAFVGGGRYIDNQPFSGAINIGAFGSREQLIALADSEHAHAADALALTQSQVLGVAQALHTQSADAVAFAQQHLVGVDDALHAHSADGVLLSQAQLLAVADADHAHVADLVALVQAHLLAIADAAHEHGADGALAFVQAHVLAIAEALHAHNADPADLSGAQQLIVQDSTHAHDAELIAFIQDQLLVLDDALHGHTADEALALLQQHVLVIGSAVHAHNADPADLSGAQQLIVEDANHAQDADNVVLIQAHALELADSEHAHAAENVVWAQAHLLAIADSEHGHIADNVVLSTAAFLGVDDALHAHGALNIDIAQVHILSIAEGAHAHTADNVVLVPAGVLVIGEGTHAHTADALVWTQDHLLVIDAAAHAQAADNLALDVSAALELDDATHQSSADAVVFTQAHLLAIAEGAHGLTSDQVALIQDHALTVAEALHGHVGDNVQFFTPADAAPPTGRTLFVLRGDRVVFIK